MLITKNWEKYYESVCLCGTQDLTCAIVAVDQAGDVGFGLTSHQVRWTELFQHPVVVVLINLPLIIDPRWCEEERPQRGGTEMKREVT